MRALQVLAKEHSAIAAACARFSSELETILAGGAVDPEALDRLLAFFEVQVDGHHQEKEERVYLPRLLARAQGEDVLVLRSLLDDHGAQRKLLAHLRNQIDPVAFGEPTALAVLLRGARRYLRAQHEHSQWEQETLFPVARRILQPRDDRALRNGFRRVDELWGTAVWDAERSLAAWLDQRALAVLA